MWWIPRDVHHRVRVIDPGVAAADLALVDRAEWGRDDQAADPIAGLPIRRARHVCRVRPAPRIGCPGCPFGLQAGPASASKAIGYLDGAGRHPDQ
jgi:hypothetical protein